MADKQKPQGKRSGLSSFLGERLHSMLKLYLNNLRHKRKVDPIAVAQRQLDTEFAVARKRFRVKKGQRLVIEGWNEQDMVTWLMCALASFMGFARDQQFGWFREEMPLDMVFVFKGNTSHTHLGEPDLVSQSLAHGYWLVADFKNAEDSKEYQHNGGTKRNTDKMLGYAYGARQKLKDEHGIAMKPIQICYLVFIRRKVTPKTPFELHLVQEAVTHQRLSSWLRRRRREHLKQQS